MAPFKAIIIGAGPNGLFAALLLQRAGIDCVILEKRAVADLNWGSSICLWPHSCRLLDQLGLLDEAEAIAFPVTRKCNLDSKGFVFSRSNLPDDVRKAHGHKWLLFERGDLVNMLKSHVHGADTNLHFDKCVASILSGDDGVEVKCLDGSSYTGSIVIGSDGINSTARSYIDGKGAAADGQDTVYPEGSFSTTFIGLYGHCGDLPPSVEAGTAYETHSKGFSSQLIAASPEKSYIIVYQQLPKPTRTRQRVTAEDFARFAAKHADNFLAPGLTYKQALERLRWCHQAPLEEGVAKTWFRDRVVLLGDSAHKFTPNIGFSINTGWQSAVVLTNMLRALLAVDPHPDTAALTGVFARHEAARRRVVQNDLAKSALASRVQAWDNLAWWIADRYILPHVGGDDALLKYILSPMIKVGTTLDFVPEPNFRDGTVAWVNRPREVGKAKREEGNISEQEPATLVSG